MIGSLFAHFSARNLALRGVAKRKAAATRERERILETARLMREECALDPDPRLAG